MSPTIGTVRSWNHDEGWGVIDSSETPGGCWIHATTPSTKTHMGLEPGRQVYFEWEHLPGEGVQDGHDFVATDAWYVGDEPYRRPQRPSTGAFSTSLTITFDDDPDHKTHRIPPEPPGSN
jgi:CspA family cold shock protein